MCINGRCCPAGFRAVGDFHRRSRDARWGGPDGPVGANGGTLGGIEFVNIDNQVLILDGTWQQFSFTFSTASYLAFAGTTANSILEGNYGVLEHIRIRNIGGITSNLNLWIDDVTNSFLNPAGGPMTVNFGDFEGFAPGSEVIFQEPGFSGSTASNVMPGSTAAVDDSIAHSGAQSYALGFQFVDDVDTRWVRLTTFGDGQINLPNPLIRFDGQSVLTFWMRGVPSPGAMALLGLAGLMGRSRRRTR